MKCILYLSRQSVRFIPVADIAEQNSIPRSFLAKILQKLTKIGIVESQQGNSGGFRLCRPPEDINLYEIFTAIQGPMVVNECVMDQKFCNRINFCSVHPIWVELKQEIEQKLKAVNFLSLSQNEQPCAPAL